METPAAIAKAESPKLEARIAGALWLVAILAGLFAELFVRSRLIVRGDAAATAAHIAAAYLAVSLLLYRLMRPAGRTLSLLAAGFGLAGSAVLAADLVCAYAPLILLGLGTANGNMGLQQADVLAMAFVRLHGLGYAISLAFFAVQVGLLGRLVLRSTFLPRILGMLLAIEAVCNLVHCFGIFLGAGFIASIDSWLLLPGLFGEGGMTLWLLLVGVDAAKWAERGRRDSIIDPGPGPG
ncbi:MAG TPA: DUF4386 domain-containing protein [Allosphingosinicella sp.]|jgi:hypothetical protein